MLVKLKNCYNHGGDLLPPDTIINLPEEKAKALIKSGGAEAHNPLQNDESKSAENAGGSSQVNTQTNNGGEATEYVNHRGSAEGSSERESKAPVEIAGKKGKAGAQ
jgi:hypothetical protein